MPRNNPDRFLILLLISFCVSGSATSKVFSESLQEEPLEIHVFYMPCELCSYPAMSGKMNETVYPFFEQYQANATWHFYTLDNSDNFEILTALVGEDQLYGKDPPYVVFVKGKIIQVLGYDDLSEENLIATYNSFQSGIFIPKTLNVAFTSYVILIGLVTGINPCLFVLILFLISKSLLISDGSANSKGRSRVLMRIGVVCLGVLVFYLLVGFFFFQIPAAFFNQIRPILLLILLLLGIYHVVFYKKVQWGLFRTPDRFKNLIQQVVERDNLGYDFSLGFVFASVKIPCIGGLYLILLNRIRTHPVQGSLYLSLFNISLILPLFIIMGAVALGFIGLSRTQAFTESHRGAIRLLTGALLIFAALIELILPPFVYEGF
ncbi:MAG: cytochrome c biogenesis CcdA family protein [Candidatus Heimdallarchaeota archaeon]